MGKEAYFVGGKTPSIANEMMPQREELPLGMWPPALGFLVNHGAC